MAYDEFLDEAADIIKQVVPSSIVITKVDVEGAWVVLYTKNLDEFASNTEVIRKLAQSLRRRVVLRPDPSILMPQEQATKIVKEVVPAEAEVSDVHFDQETGEVTIEAISPGPAIGRHGTVLNDLKRRIGWAPKVVRTPPIPSRTVGEIRGYLRMVSEERKTWMRKVGKRILRDRTHASPWVRLSSLGAYREVGRSATLLSTPDSKILVDCGVKFSHGEDDSPFLSAPELMPIESIDAVVITHAHLDHAGLLPALFKYGYDGAVYCTAPTRDLMSLLQLDYIKVAFGEGKKPPYDSGDIRDTVRHCIPLAYGDTTDIAPDVRLTLQNAGHILGSAICHFHIGDGAHNVAITGDVKYERTWLFNPASDKFPRLETLIMESTYGGHNDFQPSRREAADDLKSVLTRTVSRGGRTLIPVFSVGRSQEVMVVIESMMRNGELPRMPVYLDGMIWEATAIHTAYPEYLNSHLRSMIFQRNENPFLADVFQRVENSRMRENVLESPEPIIVLATSGMMSGGPVLEYFKNWCPDPKNSLVFVGFNAEGTLGRRIQRGLAEFQYSDRGKTATVQSNMQTESVDGFSGHSDRGQLMNYIRNITPRPDRVILGHGEESKCLDLASSIHKKFGIATNAPQNLETIRVR